MSGVLSVAEAVATATANGRNVKRTDPPVRVGERGDHPISLRVVIVDDSDSIRRMLKTAADMVGGIEIVGEATNGQDAVEVSTALRPHVVILDVEMPVMDGVGAIAPIRAATPSTTVVMFSSDTSRMKDALAEGASGYFEKGIISPLAVLREIVTLWNNDQLNLPLSAGDQRGICLPTGSLVASVPQHLGCLMDAGHRIVEER
ncbi:MAG: hypothetical protein NVSMB4_19020 [Acidimicrobiales bacterium]